MESLSINIAEPQVVSAPAPAPVEAQKRPGVAFVLSLLYPGLGHFYCKKTLNGFLTAAFFTAAIALAIFLNPVEFPQFWGVGLRAAIVLYGFGFLDAFYAAREINLGVEPYIVGNNPRIAAMLNLLTAGFGYFYLGERKKGLIWFFASRILFSMGARSVSLLLFIELACIVVAVDAYRIARRQLREIFPAESTNPFASSARGLSPLVPLALGTLLVLNYFLVISLGLLLPNYSNPQNSPAISTGLPNGGTVIEHPLYHVSMHVPPGWKMNQPSPNFILGASNSEFGCQVGLMMNANLPLRGQQATARQLETEIKKSNASYQWLSEGPATLGGKQAYVLHFQNRYNNIPVVEKVIFLQHRLTLYSAIEAASVGALGECGPMMDQILDSVKLGY